MRRKTAGQLTCLGLLAVSLPIAVPAAEDAPIEELATVVVTGSRIATTSREGPSPVTTITAADITAHGFTTAQEAIAALPQVTGIARNETHLGDFAQNANGISLRGLGPGRTLILVDGRRVADYPLPYEGVSNFVNLSSIPAAAVDRIEVLAGGASAIYGSDAVAGVINIILKQKTDVPPSLEVRYGDTTQGGGQSLRLQGVAGFTSGRLSTLFAAELFKRDPIYAFQRGFQNSVQDNPDPDGRFNPRSVLRTDPLQILDYVDPGSDGCDALPTLTYSFRAGRGYYCGNEEGVSQYTIRNGRQRGSLFGRLGYELDKAELYGSLHYLKSSDRLDTDFTYFDTIRMIPELYFFDVSEDPDEIGGNYAQMQRIFQPAEFGGYKARQKQFREQVVDYTAGIRGDMRGGWRYDLTLSGSEYDVKTRRPLLLSQPLLDYFLGPQLTDENGDPLYDPWDNYYPEYSARWDRLYAPVSPELYRSFTDTDSSTAKSRNRSATLVLTGDLLTLPAGPLSTAVVFEAARQSYDIVLDEQMLDGEFFAARDTGGGGSRKRLAAGVELGVPVLEQLRLKLAGRYDSYDDITAVDGAFTYNIGLEYRPVQQLLLRGSHATSFRAPDMHYVFADPSGYFVNVQDRYLCGRDEPDVPLSSCSIASGEGLEGARQGTPFLKEETGSSSTFGLVFQPISSVTLSVDYYDIKLRNAVRDSAGLLLQTEADCRLGETRAGVPVDINSTSCQEALANVVRRADDGEFGSEFLSMITTRPVNIAMIHTAGLDAAGNWKINAGAWGIFDLGLAYTRVFKYDQQDYAGDPVVDQLDSLQYFDWHSRMNASLAWTRGPFTSTLFVERNGSVPNWAETGRIGTFTTANLTTRYSGLLGGSGYIGLAIQNLFDRNPPRDPTYDEYPYYSGYNYSPVGREVFVEFGARF